jgi:uncharacterized Zn-binding protein involved in type VI secretion
MPTVAVNPPRTPATTGSGGIAAAAVPNVCKMPGPPAPFVPTPLPNVGTSDDSPDGYSTTVKIEGNAVAIKGATFKSKGDIASKATGGGIISAQTHGKTEFVAPGSLDVKIEGKNVQLLGDATLNNCGSPGNTTANNMQAGTAIGMPVLEFSETDFPGKTKNMKQKMNKRKVLSRETNRRAKRRNRRAALATSLPAGAGLSLDEFPFASSQQGGAGAAVSAIPESEQHAQGGKMSSFYQKHNIKKGQKFVVRVVP